MINKEYQGNCAGAIYRARNNEVHAIFRNSMNEIYKELEKLDAKVIKKYEKINSGAVLVLIEISSKIRNGKKLNSPLEKILE